ncbi:hypothetical protein D3C80_1078330 [compost metagenome]
MQAEGLVHGSGQRGPGSFIHGQLGRVLLTAAGGGQAQQRVLGVKQVHHTSIGPGGLHQVGEYAIEHVLEVALATEREGNGLKAADGARHAAQYMAQFAYFGHPRLHPHFAAEVEAGQALHLLGQHLQRATDAPPKYPAEHQQHGHQRGGPEQLFEQHLARTGQQLMGRHGNQHLQVLPGQVGQRDAHAIPGLALHLIGLCPGALLLVSVKVLQACNAQFADTRQAQALPFMHDYPLQVRVGHDAALVVDHGNLCAGGDAQPLGFAGQVGDRNIHADHCTTVNAALRHGQADLAGGEEHIGRG